MQAHFEKHYSRRVGWLRAAVLGANDGIVSTASLIIGVAAADVGRIEVLVAGIAALVAGAMSMAAGEYVSVSSQSDTEKADLDREKIELETDPEFEHRELAQIYVNRGLDTTLAKEVAEQLMRHDALGAHARDELGISTETTARPIQAALTSAASFTIGAALPLAALAIAPVTQTIPVVAGGSLLSLALLGVVAARAGRANIPVSVGRVTLWGAMAMLLTAVVGKIFGVIA